MMKLEDAMIWMRAGNVLCNIGQIDKSTKGKLDRMAKQGDLSKWRGHWFPIAGADYGIGPLKTCYALASA